MKIVITGGLGFIGSNFVRHMLKTRPEFTEVINLDKMTYAGNPENLADVADAPGYKLVKADICDRAAVADCLAGADMVVHFAAETHVDRSIMYPDEFIKTNVLGTQVLLDTARRLGVKRFVHICTDEVYGSVETGESVETDPLIPNSPYSASKAASDMLARSYFITYGFPVMITRCSNNFGPYQHPEKAVPLLISNALEDRPFPLYGDGRNVRDWLFVQDHVTGIEAVMDKGKPGEAYNIGGGTELANVDMITRVLDVMGKPHSLITRVKDRPGHDRRYSLSCAKIERELGWKARHSFEEAIKLTVDWYRANPDWIRRAREGSKDFHARQYAERGGGK
ncbi:MAG: dTDP-glucose 4,6-dehydratase [Elusimicrobiaceae bacterium]|nr:dTDP-glucose 4,6-dehydratase [Elusimicrobiaceae bacterium]